jgi:hypothetical protein
MMLIDFEKTDFDMYEKLLDIVSDSLDWLYGVHPFPTKSFACGLNQNGYYVDVHSVYTQYEKWKSTHVLI